MESTVLINGGSSLVANMSKGSNIFSISSELKVTGRPEGGDYFGSTVLVWKPD